jgi:NhaP-type Na+/H+ or K+/H+ antiporter
VDPQVDPVATVAIFGAMGVDRSTSVILVGESILNDAVSISFYRSATRALTEVCSAAPYARCPALPAASPHVELRRRRGRAVRESVAVGGRPYAQVRDDGEGGAAEWGVGAFALSVVWGFVAALVLGVVAALLGTLLVGRVPAGDARLQVALALLSAFIVSNVAPLN